MGFFDMGSLEILLVMVVALIIWGPGKIPEIARTLGKTMRALKKATFDLTQSVTREIDLEEKDLAAQSKDKGSNQTKEASAADKAAPGNQETTISKDKGSDQSKEAAAADKAAPGDQETTSPRDE